MKAVQVALLLLCINAGFFVVSATQVWSSEDIGGVDPQTVSQSENLKFSNPEGGQTFGLESIFGNKITVGVLIAGVMIGAASVFGSNITSAKAVGILAFSIIFTFLLGYMSGILQNMMIPDSLIVVITGFQYFWMVMAIIQLATGRSFKVMQ